MGKANTILKNSGFLFVRMVLVLLVQLYTSRVVLKVLGFEDFGIYNVVASVIIFLSFVQSALRNATFRYIAYDLGTGKIENLKKTYSMAVNSHLLLAIVFALVFEVVGVWFINNKLNILPDRLFAANIAFQFSLLTFCVNIVRSPLDSNILAHEQMNFYALISIIEVLLKLAIVYLLFITSGDKLILYSIFLSVVSVVVFVVYVIYNKFKIADTCYIFCWEKKIFKQFLSYSSWSVLVNATCIISTQAINIYYNLFFGLLANAAIGLSNQVTSGLNSLLSSFTQAFNPQIIKSYASNEVAYFKQLIMSSSKLAYFLLFSISIPIIINIDFLLKIWLDEYPPLTPILIQVSIIYYLIDALQAPLVTSVHATGKLKVHQICMSIIVFLNVPVIYFALNLGAPAVAAIAIWCSFNLIAAVARVIIMKGLIGLDIKKYLIEVVLRVVFISFLVFGTTMLISTFLSDGWIRLIVTTIISIIELIVLVYYLALNSVEKDILKSLPIVKRFFKK